MKMKLLLLVCLLTTKLFAQNLISPITISLPANPPANTADWATAMPPVMITAKGVMQGGQVNGLVQESKILVTIKKGGSKICGKFTPSTAPIAGFNSVTKVWTGAAVLSFLGQDCALAPGDYELCVTFISPTGQPLSTEVCKQFIIRTATLPNNPGSPTVSQSKFTPPINMSPVNGKQVTQKEAKAPLTFRWTPLVPKPATPVWYKLRVWQLMQNQPPAAAMKANRPVIEKDVKEITQYVKPNLMGDIELIDNKADLVWNVQALNEQGGVLGSSEPTNFMVSSTCFPDVKIKLDSANCIKLANGVTANTVFGTISVTNVPGVTINSIAYNTFVEHSTSTAIPTSSISPATIGTGSGATNFVITVANALCKKIRVEYKVTFTCLAGPQTVICADTLTMPCCACNPCSDKRTRLINDSTKFTNEGGVNSFNTITQTPKKLIKVSAQLIDVQRMGENGCMDCTKDSKKLGNFVGGSLNGNAGNLVKNIRGAAKQIEWNFTTAQNVVNYSNALNLSFPPLNAVSCCKDSIKYCVRWSFMDENCITCDTVICKVVVRNYVAPSGPFHGGPTPAAIYAKQVQQMGETYISWFNQKTNDLPKNFDEQVNALYQKLDKQEAKIELLEFRDQQFNLFNKLQQLKVGATTSMLLSSNTQCGGGDFESGTLNATEWSGAYGTIATSYNDPTLGTYTTGFSPAGVGLNNLINLFANNHSIVSKTNDPIVGSALSTTPAATNNYSFRLGNSEVGYGSEKLIKNFSVSGTGVIRFMYAMVAHAAHTNTDAPSFWVRVFNASNVQILNKVYLDPSSMSPVEKITSVSSSDPFLISVGGYKYRPWTCAKIDLSNYIGQQVRIELISTDCAQSAHMGYVYIDDWCGNCDGASSGSVNIQPISDSCIKPTTQICVKYTLPKGSLTGSGTIKLNFYQNGNPIAYTLTSPTLTTDGTHCFTINPASLPCTNGIQGYDVVATGTFTLGTATVIVTSPDPVGTAPNIEGIKPGKNNDLVCCNTLVESCCLDMKKTIQSNLTMLGNTTAGFNALNVVTSFNIGPKKIKQVKIAVLNFDRVGNNQECISCEKYTSGTISIPRNITGASTNPIEGLTAATNPLTMACWPTPCPTWNTGQASYEVVFGNMNHPGADLSDGVGDQSTSFNIHFPKQSSLSCCADTIRICIKYTFTDIDCKTCDTIICYKIINRSQISNGLTKLNIKRDKSFDSLPYFNLNLQPTYAYLANSKNRVAIK